MGHALSVLTIKKKPMIKKIFFSTILVFTFSVLQAQETGIHFIAGLDWQELLNKAESENKYIFVDCFATWCGPCKEMDKNTYPDQKAGDFFNANFISVKVQMDSSKNDDAQIRAFYADAKLLQRKYVMLNGWVSYPTFLFFSPNGKLVHRYLGFLNPTDLISIGHEALDVNLQYYTLLEKYRNKELNDTLKPVLAIRAKLLKQEKLAYSVGVDYVSNYLLKLPQEKLYTRLNWIMLDKFTVNRSDPGFPFMIEHADKINHIAKDEYYTDKKQVKIIYNKEIIPETEERELSNDEWKNLQKKFTEKYGKLGKIAVLQRRLFLAFSVFENQWAEFENAYVLYYKNVEQLNLIHINNSAWLIFQHSRNPSVLALAIKVIEPHKEDDVQSMDTYANLLYKVGRKNEAMVWEKKAVLIESDNPSNPFTHESNPTFQNTLTKMQKGEKTW